MKRILPIVVVLVIIIVASLPFLSNLSKVEAQSEEQLWEYAVMIWNVSSGEFSWHPSALYDFVGSDFAINRDRMDTAWDILNNAEKAELVDYLATVGIAGYELVDSETINGEVFYHFRKLIP